MKLSIKQKQWLWFVGLWLGGFMSVFILAKLIKLAMGV